MYHMEVHFQFTDMSAVIQLIRQYLPFYHHYVLMHLYSVAQVDIFLSSCKHAVHMHVWVHLYYWHSLVVIGFYLPTPPLIVAFWDMQGCGDIFLRAVSLGSAVILNYIESKINQQANLFNFTLSKASTFQIKKTAVVRTWL